MFLLINQPVRTRAVGQAGAVLVRASANCCARMSEGR